MESIINDLTCPITLELFEDPISVPCCGKVFSRNALVEHLEQNPICPMCNGSLHHFDASSATKNVIIAGLVDSAKLLESKPLEHKEPNTVHQWSAKLFKFADNMSELTLSLKNATFDVKPSLFIAVVDKSGSMAGNPFNQVKSALVHIVNMAQLNNLVKLEIVTYDSYAQSLNINLHSLPLKISAINALQASGGTNFNAAFITIGTILSRENLSQLDNVTVAFMTDGEAGVPCATLINSFNTVLAPYKHQLPITIHTIGFGQGCDKKLLDEIRKVGTVEGMFRYAEPGDSMDALCNKLTSLFEVSSKSSSADVTLSLDNLQFLQSMQQPNTNVLSIKFPVDEQRLGTYSTWVIGHSPTTITIDSKQDSSTKVPVELVNYVNPADRLDIDRTNRYISNLIDGLATELLAITNNVNYTLNTRLLHCALLEQRIDVLLSKTSDPSLTERLNFISQQTFNIKNGVSINIGKLQDSQFGSKFSAVESKSKPATITNVTYSKLEDKSKPIEYVEVKPYYDNLHASRSQLQNAIVTQPFNILPFGIYDLINSNDLLHKDSDGNNVLHLAAYRGHEHIMKLLLKTFPKEHLDDLNNTNETAITIAIKSRGYNRTLDLLLFAGAEIPDHRIKSLEKYCINNRYKRTAQIVGRYKDTNVTPDETMNVEYLEFLYNKEMSTKGVLENAQSYLQAVVSKQMTTLTKTLLTEHKVQPTIDMLLDHCLPKKPDAEDTDLYITMAKLLLSHSPHLINQTNGAGEAPLLKAAEKGSLPHVQLFIQSNAIIDQTNNLGNTALWVACAKRYPCIISELLNYGADVNKCNLKGNPPIYNICQRGPKKIAEQLLAKGANIHIINSNGDTLPLLCCRNGQPEILQLFLNYIDPDFINHVAQIDGFNAMFASVEQNHPECIRTLHEFGMSLEQKTASDNQILPSATPLHLAAYYNRVEAAKMLISLGAFVNSTDDQLRTPLHIAVLQKNVNIIRLLKQSGADLNAKDATGNTVQTYCNNDAELNKLLRNPAVDILMHLAKGKFTREETTFACEILTKYSGIFGFLTTNKAIDVQLGDLTTPLMHAILWSNFTVIKTLLSLGANCFIKNSNNLTAYTIAHWIKNPRVLQLLPNNVLDEFPDIKVEHYKALANLEAAQKLSTDDATILFMGMPPKSDVHFTSDGLQSRMGNYINATRGLAIDNYVDNNEIKLIDYNQANQSDQANQLVTSLVDYFDKKEYSTITTTELFWNAKVLALLRTAQGDPNKLTPKQIVAIYLFTSNELVCNLVNSSIISKSLVHADYVKLLVNTLSILPDFKGEIYIGANNVDRNLFLKGSEFSWNTFMSGSSLWRNAVEVTDFATKKLGTVFIVKAKTAKSIATYTLNHNSEVMLLPTQKYRVTNLYHGDVIALGQANIREHTFKIKPEDLPSLLNSNKAMIVEVEEYF